MERRKPGKTEKGYVLLVVVVLLASLSVIGLQMVGRAQVGMDATGDEWRFLDLKLCAQECSGIEVLRAATMLEKGTPLSAYSQDCNCSADLGADSKCHTDINPAASQFDEHCYGVVAQSQGLELASDCDMSGQHVLLQEQVLLQEIPIFQYAVFFDGPLEIHNGPPMHIEGRVHSNSDIRLFPSEGLYIHDWLTTPDRILVRRHGSSIPSNVFFPLKSSPQPASQAVTVNYSSYTELKNVSSSMLGAGWKEFKSDHRVAYGDESNGCAPVKPLRLPFHEANARTIIEWRDPDDSPDQRRQKFSWNADLIYRNGWLDRNLSPNTYVEANNPIKAPDGCSQVSVPVGDLPCQVTGTPKRIRFQETREETMVEVIPIDLGQLVTLGLDIEILYLHDEGHESEGYDIGGFFLYNAARLTGPLTIATNSRLFVQGDFNTESLTGDPTFPNFPAALVSDNFTFLSNQWEGDWRQSGEQSGEIGRDNTPDSTTLNACIMTGITAYNGSVLGQGGYHNLIRFLEVWLNEDDGTHIPFKYTGSTACIWESRLGRGRYKTDPVYSPPRRFWSFDPMYNDINKLPPGTPRLVTPILQEWELQRS